MCNKDKDKSQDSAATGEGDLTSPRDSCHANRDLSHEREARDTTLTKQVAEAVAREMAKTHAQYTAMINEMHTPVMPTSLKITSCASGFKVMDPFDWTKDKDIYQRWQLW